MNNKYPKVNYIGNKEKLADWIFDNLPKNINSFFDAFSGGASVSYEAKKRGYQVFSNDILHVNYLISKALIENNNNTLDLNDLNLIFSGSPKKGYMSDNYSDKFFFQSECMELDLYRYNIDKLDNEYKRALALILIRRAMIRKMPYSRFTIDWEKIKQLRDEEYSYLKYKRKRAYHNESFKSHFIKELSSYNDAVFNNKKKNIAYNDNIFDLASQITADVIYLDPPYIGTMNNYYGFYGLLDEYISSNKLEPFKDDFTDKKKAIDQFNNLFSILKNYKYWVLSYNNKSSPSKEELLKIISKYSSDIQVIERPYSYKTTGKKNKYSNLEYLFIIKYK